MARKLETYERKRHFDVTPEPPPDAPASRAAGRPTFMVHKHHARRLHYDLRLEIDGALASWAVPKGPSYDPAVKRLAVETEDHPLAYGGFEGRIPDGEYGAGDSIIWDRGTFDTDPPGQAAAMRRKGHLVIDLAGEKLAGKWHLVRTGRGGGPGKTEWLLFKAKDGREDAAYDVVAACPESVLSGRIATRGPVAAKTIRARHPPPLELLLRVWPPMLASLATADEVRPGDHLEVKYDGFRALAAVAGGRVSLQSRNGLDLAPRFPTVPPALARLVVGEAVLDGEIVAEDDAGGHGFQLMGEGAARIRYVVFDLLWLDGEDLRERSLAERQDLLSSLLSPPPPGVVLAESLDGPIAGALARARREGWEGVVAKRAGSPYRGGRGRDWLKVKLARRQELAVVGYTPLRGGAAGIGALLLGVRDGGALRFAGKVGTGYTDAVRKELARMLEADRVAKPAVEGAPRLRDARWVTPRLVAEVAFTEWTGDGKLRHPSFQGLRADKRPDECVREEPAGSAGSAAPARRRAAAVSGRASPGRGSASRTGMRPRSRRRRAPSRRPSTRGPCAPDPP
jgi:bifunctional non-homologous end joining protein LigD